MTGRSVGVELHRVERAALAQLVENIQQADALLAELEQAVPGIAGRVARIRVQLYQLPPMPGSRAQREAADDELARAWGEQSDDDKGGT